MWVFYYNASSFEPAQSAPGGSIAALTCLVVAFFVWLGFVKWVSRED